MRLIALAGKSLDVAPFFPAIITFIAQLAGLWIGQKLADSARKRLQTAGLEDQKLADAQQGVLEFALVSQVYTNFVPLLLVVLVVRTPGVTDSIKVALLVVAVALLVLTGVKRGELYQEFNDAPGVRRILRIHEKALLKLHIRSYGSLLTWMMILATLVYQAFAAYLSLPNCGSPSGSIPPGC